MQSFLIILAACFFLLSTAFLTALSGALRRLHLQDPGFGIPRKYFFYLPFHRYFFPHYEYEGLLCAAITAQTITRFLYSCFALIFLFETTPLLEKTIFAESGWFIFVFLTISGFIAALFLFGEYIPRILGAKYPEPVIGFCAPISSFFMLLSFPITYPSLRLSYSHFQSVSFEEPLTKTKRELIEIIQRSRVGPELNPHEKKLIEYVLRFKDKIAREVMVPRVDVFSLSADTPIKLAANLVKEEGYSRIPVYRNTVDNIVGVLMYKDVLNEYMRYQASDNDLSILEAPVEKIQKGVLYTPETKKISNLLLEFRKKQVHLAIVVDEYGGTEGIVTIEDILEEIVGEIEDEYDEEEETCFPQSDGSWIVDARMSILELEQQLGILIPSEGDYDTIGGFIFHCAGSIPPKGFIIHKEEFEIEILHSDERRVEKVRLKPITPLDAEDEEGDRFGSGEKGSETRREEEK